MLSIASFFMVFLAVLVLGLEAPLPGYAVEEITWEVQAFADGTMVNVTGTIEQVYDKLVKINPDFLNTVANITDTVTELRVAGTEHLDPGVSCGPNGHREWDRCYPKPIADGIKYLRGVPGSPANGPGPGACGRVSCSWKSAIWWCNDNDHTYTLNSFGDIANCAAGILEHCSYVEKNWEYVIGMNFMPNNWNCIVRFDSDDC
ncbi:hypothetical protein B0H66DRAFT_178914 [Apodospora peruviana]|uniref:Uncharacterized protein n=1 Tax=Apodospora peruviana TaxID=516989 RepID=A0AAE0M7Q5_9PEZI|nr:hypothetical protein B0H66DRAFT_178914 [Apodospora peruviana]